MGKITGMKRASLLIAMVCCLAGPGAAQQGHLGLGGLPADTDSICAIPVYTGGYLNSGFQAGDTVPGFTLYDINGDSLDLGVMLSGKPALLVAGSYTCPVFRGKIPALNDMALQYGSMLHIVVIYTVEAHPVVDPSPYSGTVWVPSSNYSDSVLFEQAKTYGARRQVADSMLKRETINVPVLIDGPCNEWWTNFGPAPNNAYLVRTDGTVAAKHAWYHKAPDNMYCDIDSLLGTSSGKCSTFGNNGVFSYTLDLDSVATGMPGQTLAVNGMLRNLSSTENTVIDVIKKQVVIPAGWSTALCGDVCYAPTVDSVRITLSPSDSLPFIFYFYTDQVSDSGYVRVLFRNAFIPGNRKRQGFYAYTNTALGVAFADGGAGVKVFPVPVKDRLYIRNGVADYWRIITIRGATMLDGQEKSSEIDVGLLAPGMYILELAIGHSRITRKFLVTD